MSNVTNTRCNKFGGIIVHVVIHMANVVSESTMQSFMSKERSVEKDCMELGCHVTYCADFQSVQRQEVGVLKKKMQSPWNRLTSCGLNVEVTHGTLLW